MVPREVVDDALASLDQRLQPTHPLREHQLFPFLKREDAKIWILTKDDDDSSTWLLDLTRKQRIMGRTCFALRTLADDAELEALIQRDHELWLAQFYDEGDGLVGPG